MKAVIINEDESLMWSDAEGPAAKENEVKIKVSVASINRVDLFQREGSYPPPVGAAEWMGLL